MVNNIAKTYMKIKRAVAQSSSNNVNSINQWSQKQNYSSPIHLAISYLDIILRDKNIEKSKIKELAIGCLAIAAKFDEYDDDLPLSEEFIINGNLHISIDQFIKTEKLLLNEYLHWDLNIKTTYSYVEMLLAIGIVFIDDSVTYK